MCCFSWCPCQSCFNQCLRLPAGGMLKAINNELSSKYQLEKMMDLKNGPTQIGTMVTVAAPEVTEVLAAAGFDWLFIDGEHGALGVSEVQLAFGGFREGFRFFMFSKIFYLRL